MKYFYAIVYCNSTNTSKRIFKEYNGYELELTNIKLNLSFVEDSLTFPQALKEEADEVPPGYAFDVSKVSRALNHSTVKLSWDQNDPKRQARLANNYKAIMKKNDDDYNSSEEDKAYKGLIAGSSDESVSDVDEQDSEQLKQEQLRIEEMRKKLLGGLSKTDDRKRKNEPGSDEEELEVNFGIGFGEDIG